MSNLINYLNAQRARSGVWVDNETIAFLSTESGVPQIWKINLKDGVPQQVTDFKERLLVLQSNPTQKAILFTMDLGGNEQEQIYKIDSSGVVTRLTDDDSARHNLGGITNDGKRLIMASNGRDKACFDIVSLDLDSMKQEIIIKNDDNYNTPAALSPDGNYLIYNKLKAESDNCFWMANLKEKVAMQVPKGGSVAKYTSPSWKSDSKGFYFVTDAENDFSYVGFYDLEKEETTVVYQDESWGVDSISLSADNRYLAINVNRDAYSDLIIYDLVQKVEVNTIKPPMGVAAPYERMSWSPEGHVLLFSLTSGKRMQDLWVLDLDQDKLQKITNSSTGGVIMDELVEPLLMRYTSFDGLSIPYWLYKPIGKELKDLAIMIDIHGGPEGQELPMYDPITQYLVSQDIAVVAPNVRGSTGYGKIYTHLDDKGKRLDSVRDIECLVAHLIETGVADKKKIAVSGGSYGGFMTLSCAARYPDLFCCAVDTVGMFNLVTFLENTADYRRPHRESEYGALATDREMLFNVSPIAKVDQIRGPLMVIHGANDPRVPVSEAEAVVSYLKEKGVTVEYLRYEDEGHGISKIKNRLDCYPKVVKFLKKNMNI